MKKKVLLLSLLISLFIVVFAMVASAETPSLYIEFDVKLEGNQDYTTVYVKNTEGGNPRVNLTFDFYSDVEFTQAVDKSSIIAMDFSSAVHYGNSKDYVDRFTTASADVFPKCEEIKWFSRVFTSIPSKLFNGWAQLKRFDFGCATMVDYNLLTGTGIENIVIPASVNNLNNGVFQNCTSLKTVKIEGAITKMGLNEFYGCTSLTSVDLGATTILGENMFQGCTALTELEIPSTVTQINKQAMYNCTSLETVKLSSLPYIGEGMFYKCTSLESIELPSSITEIKGNAFRECSALKSITIPENVTKIGNLAFYKTAITSLHIPANVESLGYQVAEETPIESLTFAENSKLTFIDHRAFQNCDSLVGPVILPDGLVEIDYGLFSGCAKLKAVKMPDSVTTLSGNSALFSQCPELEFVQFSKNITSICKSMFEGCKALKAISLPDKITSIDYKAFRDCTSLEAVYLPSSLTNLGNVSDSSTDWGTFYQSGKVYFVQESFEV
ncbi:MAG: leucine-rich repeat protein, partial [Clostridia bacterium]|nr:leucine-rich repeat protein [Clostridia bacterium]